jgi:hypothetical protein
VADLSPLKGMPLQHLLCDFKPERDAAILRSIKTLETINSVPAKVWLGIDLTKVTGSAWLDLLQIPHDVCVVRPREPWVKRDGTWTTSVLPESLARLAFPVAPQGGYDLTAEVSRQEGDDCIALVLPVGGRSVVLGYHHWGTVAGLSSVGGVPCWAGMGNNTNPTTVKHEPFPVGKKVAIAVSVRVRADQAEVTAKADGAPPIKWSGPIANLSAEERVVCRPGWLGVTSSQTRYILHALKFRRVDGVARVHRLRPLTP